jgi:hypothetical protein
MGPVPPRSRSACLRNGRGLRAGQLIAAAGALALAHGIGNADFEVMSGTAVPGTGKSFEVDLATTARWQAELMVEEWVFWDSALMAQQIGLA